MEDTVLSTGFTDLDEVTGGFRYNTTALVVAPPDFGYVEYAHYLVRQADQLGRVTAVVTPDPDVMPELEAYANYVQQVHLELDPDRLAFELEQLPLCPQIVFAVNVSDEQAVALAQVVRRYATLIVFAGSNAGAYDARRPLREVFAISELVLHGARNVLVNVPRDFWTIIKNKSGGTGVMVPLSARIKGAWES